MSLSRRFLCALSALLFLLASSVPACARRSASPQTRECFAMDTLISFTVYDAPEGLLDAAEVKLYEWEALLSATNPNSALSRLNDADGAWVEWDADALAVLDYALEVARESGGALDPTLYPLSCAWGFPSKSYRVPAPEELAALLDLTGYQRIERDGNRIRLPKGMALDFGAVAKGYVAQRLAEYLIAGGAGGANISLGGNVHLEGGKPNGTPWQVAIGAPRSEDGLLGVLRLQKGAVVTSGGYQRYFEEDGLRYQHILDPRTGCPVEGDLQSVTVICADGARADALSTALYVLGAEGATALLRGANDFELVLLTNEGRLLISGGLRDIFQPQEGLDYAFID